MSLVGLYVVDLYVIIYYAVAYCECFMFLHFSLSKHVDVL